MLSRTALRSIVRTPALHRTVAPLATQFTRSIVSSTTKDEFEFIGANRRPQTDQQRTFSYLVIAGLSTLLGAYYLRNNVTYAETKATPSQKVNYDEVRRDIASILDKDGYDDGSLGPLFVRLAWHSSGSYSEKDGNGGSNGAHIRYGPQKFWGGNAGIQTAINELEPIKKKHPGISYGDLYTLCGVVAIEEMGGPVIPWRPGRVDHAENDEFHKKGPQQDNRLPDGAKGSDHLRDVFYRMGFNDKDIVVLSGAHSLGRCHRDRSGFDGPWSRAPTTFSNQYYQLLLNEEWAPRKWDGPFQFTNVKSGSDLMMLPSDIALIKDPNMRPYVEKYAENEEEFFNDFAAAFSKLLELGVSFHASESKAWYNKLFG